MNMFALLDLLLTKMPLAPAKSPPSPQASCLPIGQSCKLTPNEADGTGSKIMKQIIEADSPPTRIPLDYINTCTADFATKNKLGSGTFGEVYMGRDESLQVMFAVKRIRCDLSLKGTEKDLKDVKARFEQEIETLKHYRHPNLARLFAYFVGENLSDQHCLVYELASGGSLDSYFRDDLGREKLGWHRRLQIALDITKALCYLHQVGRGLRCYHRDVKSANICLTNTFAAKLVDCGLSQLISEERPTFPGVSISTLNSGASVVGTPGYMCPTYCRTRKFTSMSEIFSLGMVLLELITGKLQNHEENGLQVDYFERYIEQSEPACLVDDVDKLAGEWNTVALRKLCKLALECISPSPRLRPEITENLRRIRMMTWKYCIHLSDVKNERKHFKVRSKHIPIGKATEHLHAICQICYIDSVPGLLCSASPLRHFLCNECFEEHVLKHAADEFIQCPLMNCSSEPFSQEQVVSHLTKHGLLIRHEAQNQRQMVASVEKLGQQLGSKMDTCVTHLQASEKEMRETLKKIERGMLSLASGRCICPSLFILTPRETDDSFFDDPGAFFSCIGQKSYNLHFLCGHDYSPIDAKIEMSITREWLRKAAPILKVALVALQISMKVTLTFAPDLLACIPIEGTTDEKLQMLERSVELIQDTETSIDYAVAAGGDYRSFCDDAYPLVEKLALEQSTWRKEMVQVYGENGIMWVKNEYRGCYSKNVPSGTSQTRLSRAASARNEGEAMVGKKRRICIIVCVVLAVIAIVLVASLFGRKKRQKSPESQPREDPQDPGAQIPTLGNESKLENIQRTMVELGVSDVDAFSDNLSPQSRAAQWLADEEDASTGETKRLVQRYVLAVLYHSMNGEGWNNQFDFLSPNHECSWRLSTRGVQNCDAGWVTGLRLTQNRLMGRLPRELSNLTRLTYLSFYQNRLRGTIPTIYGTLTDLTYFSVSNNYISGSIPTQVGLLSDLTKLYLWKNALTGPIPAVLGSSLTKLKDLYLVHNKLNGTIPTLALTKLKQVEEMLLDDNSLEGNIDKLCDELPDYATIRVDWKEVQCKCCRCCPDRKLPE